MKQHRPKQPQWIKPFKIIQRREDFLKLDSQDGEPVPRNDTDRKKENKESKKDNIPTQKVELISRVNKINNDDGIPLNYIRITSRLNLPKIDKYELSEVDYIFLQANENKYTYGNKKALTVELLEKVIVELELMTGKDSSNIPKNNEAKLRAMLERQYDFIFKMDNCDEFVRLVYNHWRSRREELKTPLLRVLWKPHPDDTNHYLAFRPREKDEKQRKKQLRRQNKPTEDETLASLEGLLRQFQDALAIVERVKAREHLKMDATLLGIRKFNLDIKGLNEDKLFAPQINRGDMQKRKENLVKLTKQFDSKKAVEQPEDKIDEETPEDTKLAMANFIATLVSRATKSSIDIDSMVSSGRIPTVTQSSSALSYQASAKPDTVISKPRQQQSNILRFSLASLRNNQDSFLVRTFEQRKYDREDNMDDSKGVNNYFKQKQKYVQTGYFFEQDEEEQKDTRKNYSTSFKKWKGDNGYKV